MKRCLSTWWTSHRRCDRYTIYQQFCVSELYITFC